MANKRGPLSKVEVFYIEEQTKKGLDIHIIAQDLDRPLKAIQKQVAKAEKQNNIVKSFTAVDQFARKNGAVVMTENASTLGDARRKTGLNKRPSCITKIKDE